MSSRSVEIVANDARATADVDPINDGLVVQSAIHANIHRGIMFSITQQAELAADAVVNLLIQPSGGMHLRMSGAVTHQMVIELFEGTTFSAAGTPLTSHNRNRFSTNTAGANITLAPTLTGDGTLLAGVLVPGGTADAPVGGQAETFGEWILDGSKVYMLRISNDILTVAAAGRFGLSFNFYEPAA